MVNYQGPKSLRPIVEAFDIPMFDRVQKINYRVTDLSEIQLEKNDVARLHDLERISVSRRGVQLVDESEIRAAHDLVPACRLLGVESVKNQINIDVKPGSQLACCQP
ncbi:MAG: hypothetical protein ACR2NZ_14110 [Rubripirellula sp.]